VNFFKKGSIEKKLLLLVVGSSSLPALITLGLLYWQQTRLERIVADIVTTRNMEAKLEGYYDLCKSHKAGEQKLVKDMLNREQIGMHGYVYVLKGTGEARGTYILSKDGKRDGENIWESKDHNGRAFIQDIIAKGLQCAEGRMARSDPYPWKNPDEAVARIKVAYLTYYEPWDWVIGVSLYEDDRDILVSRVSESFMRLFGLLIGVSSGMILLAIILGISWSRGITRPLSMVIEAAQSVARGDLAAAETRIHEACLLIDPAMAAMCRNSLPCREKDPLQDNETGQLILAIGGMIRNLKSLIGEIQGSSVQLLSTATEIAATARQQESTINNLGASTNEIAASVNEISATSRELSDTMDRVTTTAGETSRLAGSGRSGMKEMEENIRALSAAANSVSAKLATIHEKAGNINTVMATITKVADQTNLLSLNAAIEAEKAGEHGMGFGVVSREIRRLADQTAVAAVGIERMVKEMQSSVASGVMEMEKFARAMESGRQQIEGIGSLMGKIIAQVEDLTPQFQQVRDGMKSQSQGAQQINEAMMLLTTGTRSTLESLKDFNLATEHMHRAMKGLKDEVQKIIVSN
jgi:methyl-accepting chemotaxis protein